MSSSPSDPSAVAAYQMTGQDVGWLLRHWAAKKPDHPFLVWEPGPALLVSRVLTLTMLFICGLALGRHAGGGGWKAGLGMTVLGVVLTAAIIALGG